ncbi:hypothetical protein TNCV_3313381 [Trichonephila clavipes]|nr:hypothetical protein TNCV_3313381 [Trichonephila clavipes]
MRPGGWWWAEFRRRGPMGWLEQIGKPSPPNGCWEDEKSLERLEMSKSDRMTAPTPRCARKEERSWLNWEEQKKARSELRKLFQ